MTDTVNPEIPSVEVEPKELSPLHIIKTEANLAGLPFFALSRQDAKGKKEVRYVTKVERDGKTLEVSWSVTPNVKYGYPGPFDRKVHKAMEYIINERGIPVENPIPFSIYHITQILGIKRSGKTSKEIREALRRVVHTAVDSEGTFYSKKKRQYISDSFHIYDRVVFREQALPSGEVADTNYLFLSQWYLDSINAFYIRPIDFDYFQQLKSDIAGRLYELLGLKFHGIILNRRPYWKVEYEELCDLLPISPQKFLSNAKRYLGPAHRELVKTQFLSKVRWNARDSEHWYIVYYPGRKAFEDAKPKALQEELQLEAPESPQKGKKVSGHRGASKRASTAKNGVDLRVSELTSTQKRLFSELRDRGVAKQQARHVIKDHEKWISRAIELFDLELDRNPGKIRKPGAYLVSMIEAGEDWQPPGDYVSKEEQEQRHKEEEKRKQEQKAKEEEERRKRGQYIGHIVKVMESLTDQEKGEIREEVLRRVKGIYRKQKEFAKLSEKDITTWQSVGILQSHLYTLRNEVIEERYLSKGGMRDAVDG